MPQAPTSGSLGTSKPLNPNARPVPPSDSGSGRAQGSEGKGRGRYPGKHLAASTAPVPPTSAGAGTTSGSNPAPANPISVGSSVPQPPFVTQAPTNPSQQSVSIPVPAGQRAAGWPATAASEAKQATGNNASGVPIAPLSSGDQLSTLSSAFGPANDQTLPQFGMPNLQAPTPPHTMNMNFGNNSLGVPAPPATNNPTAPVGFPAKPTFGVQSAMNFSPLGGLGETSGQARQAPSNPTQRMGSGNSGTPGTGLLSSYPSYPGAPTGTGVSFAPHILNPLSSLHASGTTSGVAGSVSGQVFGAPASTNLAYGTGALLYSNAPYGVPSTGANAGGNASAQAAPSSGTPSSVSAASSSSAAPAGQAPPQQPTGGAAPSPGSGAFYSGWGYTAYPAPFSSQPYQQPLSLGQYQASGNYNFGLGYALGPMPLQGQPYPSTGGRSSLSRTAQTGPNASNAESTSATTATPAANQASGGSATSSTGSNQSSNSSSSLNKLQASAEPFYPQGAVAYSSSSIAIAGGIGMGMNYAPAGGVAFPSMSAQPQQFGTEPPSSDVANAAAAAAASLSSRSGMSELLMAALDSGRGYSSSQRPPHGHAGELDSSGAVDVSTLAYGYNTNGSRPAYFDNAGVLSSVPVFDSHMSLQNSNSSRIISSAATSATTTTVVQPGEKAHKLPTPASQASTAASATSSSSLHGRTAYLSYPSAPQQEPQDNEYVTSQGDIKTEEQPEPVLDSTREPAPEPANNAPAPGATEATSAVEDISTAEGTIAVIKTVSGRGIQRLGRVRANAQHEPKSSTDTASQQVQGQISSPSSTNSDRGTRSMAQPEEPKTLVVENPERPQEQGKSEAISASNHEPETSYRPQVQTLTVAHHQAHVQPAADPATLFALPDPISWEQLPPNGPYVYEPAMLHALNRYLLSRTMTCPNNLQALIAEVLRPVPLQNYPLPLHIISPFAAQIRLYQQQMAERQASKQYTEPESVDDSSKTPMVSVAVGNSAAETSESASSTLPASHMQPLNAFGRPIPTSPSAPQLAALSRATMGVALDWREEARLHQEQQQHLQMQLQMQKEREKELHLDRTGSRQSAQQSTPITRQTTSPMTAVATTPSTASPSTVAGAPGSGLRGAPAGVLPWRARSTQTPANQQRSEVDREVDAIRSKVNGALNKLTHERFQVITEKLAANLEAVAHINPATGMSPPGIGEVYGAVLQEAANLIFEKAIIERTFSALYARLCSWLTERLPVVDKSTGLAITAQLAKEKIDAARQQQGAQGSQPARLQLLDMRRMLVSLCEREFERQRQQRAAAIQQAKQRPTSEHKSPDEEEEDAAASRLRERMLGNIRFIGELYLQGVFSVKIIKVCIDDLYAPDFNAITAEMVKTYPSPSGQTSPEILARCESLECVCDLLTVIGRRYCAVADQPPSAHQSAADRQRAQDVNDLFKRLDQTSQDKSLPQRYRFKIMDLIDLRANRWVPRNKKTGPTTLTEARTEAQLAQVVGARVRSTVLSALSSSPTQLTPTTASVKNRYRSAIAAAAAAASSSPKEGTGISDSVAKGSSTVAQALWNNSGQLVSPSSAPVESLLSSGSPSGASADGSGTSGLAEEFSSELVLAPIRQFARGGTFNALVDSIKQCMEELAPRVRAEFRAAVAAQSVLALLLDHPNYEPLFDLVPKLVLAGVLEPQDVVVGLADVGETLDDSLSDAPSLPTHLGKLFAHWVFYSRVSMSMVQALFTKPGAVSTQLCTRITTSFIKSLLQLGVTSDEVQNVVREPGYDLATCMGYGKPEQKEECNAALCAAGLNFLCTA